jgi:outer membrane lipoprotein-sorting protein
MAVSRFATLSRSRLRWVVPAVAAATVIGVGPLVNAVTANAHGSLPPRTAAQLLVDVHHPEVQALSGTVVETTNLGLPAMPGIGGQGGDQASFSSLVTGSHTMRVWYDGPQRARIALLGQLGESDLVRNGSNLWAWSSHDNTATHWSVPTGGSKQPLASPSSPAEPTMTPQQAAQAALKAISPSTRVTTDPTAMVAGRPAYQLDLVPRDPRSLIGSIRIAIDGQTHIPTRVQVFARGASAPAFQVGFTSLSTSVPPSSVFAFRPPPGATVKQASPSRMQRPDAQPQMAGSEPQTFGKGWTTVVVGRLPQDKGSNGGPLGMLGSLPEVSGTWGSGHLLRSSIFSVVLTDDGRIAVGAVAPSMLYHALSRA